jgi:hypothetical protein
MVLFATPDFGASGVIVLFIPVAAGVFCGIISIALSLSAPGSSLGFRCGLGTVIWGLVWPLLCFCLAGRHLLGVAYLVFALPILPGLLGIGLSRLKPGLGFQAARGIGVLVAITLVVVGMWHWHTSFVAGREMMGFLDGKSQPKISNFQIDYGQQRVICTDKAVCGYLADAMKKAIRGRGPDLALGGSGAFTFRFDSGSSYYIECAYIFDKGFSISIPEANPPEAGWPTHEVDFPEPVPDRVQKIWDFLHRPDNKVFGMVMTVEDGSPVRLEYDRSLDIEGRNRQNR